MSNQVRNMNLIRFWNSTQDALFSLSDALLTLQKPSLLCISKIDKCIRLDISVPTEPADHIYYYEIHYIPYNRKKTEKKQKNRRKKQRKSYSSPCQNTTDPSQHTVKNSCVIKFEAILVWMQGWKRERFFCSLHYFNHLHSKCITIVS